MLHGRRSMMLNMPLPNPPSKAVWVDLGGGTGSNLEYFTSQSFQTAFSKVVVVDLTPSLASVAKRRVQRRGWDKNGLVDVVVGDATDPSLPGLPASGTADIVTLSYAITMIPNWKDAILNAKRMLKPGGVLCACDFTVEPERQSWLSRAFWTKLFRTDGVHLDSHHLTFMRRTFKEVEVHIQYGSFPYVPSVLKAPYYWAVFRKE